MINISLHLICMCGHSGLGGFPMIQEGHREVQSYHDVEWLNATVNQQQRCYSTLMQKKPKNRTAAQMLNN